MKRLIESGDEIGANNIERQQSEQIIDALEKAASVVINGLADDYRDNAGIYIADTFTYILMKLVPIEQRLVRIPLLSFYETEKMTTSTRAFSRPTSVRVRR